VGVYVFLSSGLSWNSKILSFRSGKFFQGFKEDLKWFEEACLQD
jgi:hypothetical protein